MQDFINRLRRWSHRLFGWFPFAWGGLFLLLGTIWVFFEWGGNRHDYILVVVGAVVLTVIAISCLSTIFGSLLIWFRLKHETTSEPLNVVVGRRECTSFQLPVSWWLPLIQADWKWLSPHVEIEVLGQNEWVTFARRGEWAEVHREIHVEDVFGICRIRFQHIQQCMIKVSPNMGALRGPQLVQGIQSGGDFSHPLGKPEGDRVDIRNYAHGDPMRFILWKVYARSQELVVRTPERAFQPAQKSIAYLIAADADSAAAGAAAAAIDSQSLGKEWKFAADGFPEPVSEKEAAQDAILRSSQADAEQGANLQHFIQEARDSTYCRVLVFAPPRSGSWVSQVIDAASKIQVSVIIALDGISGSYAFGAWMELFVEKKSDNNPCVVEKKELQKLLHTLHSAGVDVKIADRTSGTIISSLHFDRLAS